MFNREKKQISNGVKKYLLLLPFILQFAYTNAQYYSLLETDNIWEYIPYFQGIQGCPYRYYIGEDTIINGSTYKKIFGQMSGDSLTYYEGACREDTINKTVYRIPLWDSTEHILYDFSINVGDTFDLYIYYMAKIPSTVTFIDSIFVQSSYRKRFRLQTVSNCPNGTFYWIEGIGSTTDLFHGIICWTDISASIHKFTSGSNLLYHIAAVTKPTANFAIDSIVFNTVYFRNTSFDECQLKWFFGDGDSASNLAPVHIYQNTGTYNVMLITYIADKSDTIVKQVQITCNNLTSAFSFTDSLLTITFTDLSTNATGWLWDFGDGKTDTIQHPVHIYNSAGTYIVMLLASYSICSDTAYDTIIVSDFTGISDNIFKNNFQIYPNPNNGMFTVELEFNEEQNAELKIINILGIEVFSEKLIMVSGTYQKQIDLKEFAKGIYNVRVIANGGVINKQVVLE